MKPSIFISHSCKDREAIPPAGLSPEQVNARAERLAFARGFRDDLHQRLHADPRFDVFLDVRGGLAAGDVWQDGLHRALRDCRGAVLLLSPEALESGWVLKEATILSWRVFLGEPIKVVPVLLGVSETDLGGKGFGAINLGAIQCVKVDKADDAHRAQAIDEVLAVIGAISADALEQAAWKSTAERWMHELAVLLRGAVPAQLEAAYLREMHRALGIEPDADDRFDADPFFNIALQVLTADTEAIIRLLNEAGTPNAVQREEMRNKVTPLWVDAAAASQVHFAHRHQRVIAIDAASTMLARDYVLRAFCGRIAPDRVLDPGDVNDGNLDGILERVDQYLLDWLPVETPVSLASDIEKNGPAFVLLGPGIARPDVLESLTAKYARLTFVAVTGAQWRRRLQQWADRVLFLLPQLQPDRERYGKRYRNRLQAFVTQQT